jgi:hypothetical protein
LQSSFTTSFGIILVSELKIGNVKLIFGQRWGQFELTKEVAGMSTKIFQQYCDNATTTKAKITCAYELQECFRVLNVMSLKHLQINSKYCLSFQTKVRLKNIFFLFETLHFALTLPTFKFAHGAKVLI